MPFFRKRIRHCRPPNGLFVSYSDVLLFVGSFFHYRLLGKSTALSWALTGLRYCTWISRIAIISLWYCLLFGRINCSFASAANGGGGGGGGEEKKKKKKFFCLLKKPKKLIFFFFFFCVLLVLVWGGGVGGGGGGGGVG